MKRTIQVRITKGERQYVAECLDLPVVTQAATLNELASNIREAISLHIEGEDFPNLVSRATRRSSRPWSLKQ
jgi:predicted RNase H-like HicB family nuclease